MQKQYDLSATLYTGHLRSFTPLEWDWSNFTAADSSDVGYAGYDTGYWWYATNMMFNATTLESIRNKSHTVTSITLEVNCTQAMTGETYIAYKFNDLTSSSSSNDGAWARSENGASSTGATENTIAYKIPAQSLTLGVQTFSLKTSTPYNGVPVHGLVAGPNEAVNGRWRFEWAKLHIYTDEIIINYNKGSYGTGSDYTDIIKSGSTLRGAGYYSRTGYTQDGWSVNANGSTKDYNLSATCTSSAETINLYPHWKIDTYTISYNGNGTGVSNVPSSQTKTYGQDLTLRADIPVRSSVSAGSYTVTYNSNGGSASPAASTAARTTSYTFKNWNTAANGSGTSYTSSGNYTANATATLYAQWNSSTTTAAVALPSPGTKTGYVLSGWYTASSGGTRVGGAGSSYTPTGDITLYAQWIMANTVRIVNGTSLDMYLVYVVESNSLVPYRVTVANGTSLDIYT